MLLIKVMTRGHVLPRSLLLVVCACLLMTLASISLVSHEDVSSHQMTNTGRSQNEALSRLASAEEGNPGACAPSGPCSSDVIEDGLSRQLIRDERREKLLTKERHLSRMRTRTDLRNIQGFGDGNFRDIGKLVRVISAHSE